MHPTLNLIDPSRWPTPSLDYDELARREREQRFLASAGEALASSLDYVATLNQVAHMAAGSIADFCVVEIVGPDGRLERVASEDVEPGSCDELCEAVDGVRVDEGHWAVVTALREQRVIPVSVDDLPADEFGTALRHLGARSIIIAPLLVRERSIGVLVLGSRDERHPYDEPQAALAAEVARRAAIAIDNARLHAEAQRAIQARDHTLAVVAHDLRNPLGVISMTAALVKEIDEPGPAVVARMDAIERAATTMNRLIQDLLDAARIDAGKLRLDLTTDRAESFLCETGDAMRPLAERAELTLELRIAEGLPPVLADRVRLIQALGNLVGNAIKFTASGGRVELAAEPAGSGMKITVSDSGAGIEPDHLAHLFDRFWQKEPGDRRGVGLGLGIAKGIVEAHGARLDVSSQVGQGTVFSFELKAAP